MNIVRSTAVPLPIENIDTDQIIPARFLKATTREGFGENLFRDWRYDHEGNPKPDFVLNDKTYSGSILVAGRNFGCGSSREHAAWALADYGFKVIISSFFADIFKSNALNNFILPIHVTEEQLLTIFEIIKHNPNEEFTVDLPNQTLFSQQISSFISFAISPYKKKCLIEGLDDVKYILAHQKEIEVFENNRSFQFAPQRHE